MNQELVIGPLDRHFARLMLELNGWHSDELKLAAETVSARLAAGDICIPITDLPLENIEPRLRATRVVGGPGEFKPLILDSRGRLYLQRYWAYEQDLARAIRARLAVAPPQIDENLLAQGLRDFFPEDPRTLSQQRAAETAVRKNFCVITGGPGTGKTRTVLIVLMLLHAQFAARGEKPRIALAAPTGKAAARMKESMQATLASLPGAQGFAEHLPSDATTVHRLLGVIPDSPYFRHGAEHPLANDVVIVDEASMVDLALMAKIMDAVPPSARLILLGDKDQLASVEAGWVLGDICQAGEEAGVSAGDPSENGASEAATKTGEASLSAVAGSVAEPNGPAEAAPASTEAAAPLGAADAAPVHTVHPVHAPLQHHIVELKTNFRFGNDSPIYNLSRAITEGRADDARALLRDSQSAAIRGKLLPSPSALASALQAPALEGFRSYLEATDAREALTRFNHFRILCSVRRGPYGVENVNALVERMLTHEGLIAPTVRHYQGRPILVLKNDYSLKLFNGDTGLILPDPEAGGALRAFFLSTDGALRRFIPARLPEHETVFAMTVHKCQGSEFDRVLFLLPDAESSILTRELIYTALTRARHGLEFWHRESILRMAIEQPTRRASGLRDALTPTSQIPADVNPVQQSLLV